MRRREVISNVGTLLGAATMGAWSSSAQAQRLVERNEAARGFDATYLAARSQYEANLAQAAQARAGHFADLGPNPAWQGYADRLLAARGAAANDE